MEYENLPVDVSGTLASLIQEANNRKIATDDSEKARNWAIVRTELQKVYAFVNEYLSEEE